MKITAMFFARNGKSFYEALNEKVRGNRDFDFIKPNSNYFGYFTMLSDSYTKCLIPRKEELSKLRFYSQDSNEILKCATERYLWDKHQSEKARKKQELDDEEKSILLNKKN